jgi:hypothetical protein
MVGRQFVEIVETERRSKYKGLVYDKEYTGKYLGHP